MKLEGADLARFEQYVEADRRRLFRLAFGLYGEIALAEDLVQETLVRIAQVWHRIDARGPHSYANTTLVRLYLRQHRRWKPPVSAVIEYQHQTVDATTHVDDRMRIVAALAQLPPRQRLTVALRYLCDQSEVQTAAVMGCSVGTVKRQTSTALEKLNESLAETSSERSERSQL